MKTYHPNCLKPSHRRFRGAYTFEIVVLKDALWLDQTTNLDREATITKHEYPTQSLI